MARSSSARKSKASGKKSASKKRVSKKNGATKKASAKKASAKKASAKKASAKKASAKKATKKKPASRKKSLAKKASGAVIAQSPFQAPEPPLHRVLSDAGKVVGRMPEVETQTLENMYRYMLLVRLLDERMMILQRQGRIGFYGACTGQEAGPVGTAAALEDRDWIYPALREGVAMLYRGYDLETYISQVFGNEGDALKGRQMPSHYADKSVNVVSWGSCIGTQVPQAVGTAMAAKHQGDDVVAVGFMGDGATSEGDFHVAMNFAGVYKAPAILVCQNNHWSISIPTERQTAARTIAEKAIGYGLPYARVDGNDVLAVYGAVKEARARAKRGEGATFLELLTYRIGAHSSSDDPRVYRDEREVDVWKQKDPLERYRAFMMNAGHLTKAKDEKLHEELGALIQAAVKGAEARGAPAVSTLFDDVYAERPWHLEEQKQELLGG